MGLMRGAKDKRWNLGIVDPPYGIGEDGRKNHTRSNLAKANDYRAFTKYDGHKPKPEYFEQLFRVCERVIIWGANHFGNMPESPAWIVWDKDNGENDFADCELAYSNFDCAVRKFKYRWNGMLQEKMANKETRIHPNQKPVDLYKWLLKNYAQPGWKILDTHGGSMSSAIACHDYGYDLTIIEKDKDYFEAGQKRLKQHQSQLSLI